MPFTTAHDSQLFRSAPRVPASEALTYFQTNVQIFGNGKADTIIVELPGVASASTLPQHDAHVEAVTRAVHEGCRGNYAAVLTAKRGMSGETHGSARRLSAAYADAALPAHGADLAHRAARLVDITHHLPLGLLLPLQPADAKEV